MRSAGGDLLLLFAATGGALAWTIQLWLSWLVADLGCHAQAGEFTIAGLGTGALWLLLGIATGAVAVAATLVAYRLMRRAGEEDRHDARRFIAAAGLALNALLVGTIAMGATSPFFLPACV